MLASLGFWQKILVANVQAHARRADRQALSSVPPTMHRMQARYWGNGSHHHRAEPPLHREPFLSMHRNSRSRHCASYQKNCTARGLLGVPTWYRPHRYLVSRPDLPATCRTVCQIRANFGSRAVDLETIKANDLRAANRQFKPAIADAHRVAIQA